MSEAENPLEPFKRAMTATMRAIAEDDELEVSSPPTAKPPPPMPAGATERTRDRMLAMLARMTVGT